MFSMNSLTSPEAAHHFAQVILEKTSAFTDRTFDYSIPGHLLGQLMVGHKVLIPFGKRQAKGYVVGFSSNSDLPAEKIKPLTGFAEPNPVFDQTAVDLAHFLAETYFCFFGVALGLMMKDAPGKARGKKGVVAAPASQPADAVSLPLKIKAGPPLVAEQEHALQTIFNEDLVSQKGAKPTLLWGVAGSGKTEVYLRAIERVLREGKNALVLVPEIGLTPLLEEKFRERFSDHLAVLHSSLKDRALKTEWQRIKNGHARIVLGTRMALFSPMRCLGVIIMDEEYEITYKSDRSPRYHARTVAEWLAAYYKVPLVLGTATPSLESYSAAMSGRYQLARLSSPMVGAGAQMEVVDLRKEADEGNFGLLSRSLRKALKKTLEEKGQALLFLNRRGYSTSAICADCGEIIRCPNCSVALAYFSSTHEMACAKCGFRAGGDLACANCFGTKIKFHGAGTEKITQEIKINYPRARVLVFDGDSLSGHESLLAFAQGKADILIGTQLVTKGLDLPRLSLVASINPDQALAMPDFRSEEHAFQLLTQLWGKAGRGAQRGTFILQTRDPENAVIQSLAQGNIDEYYVNELENRKAMKLPPAAALINLVVAGKDEKLTLECAEKLKKELLRHFPPEAVLGGSWALIKKVRGNFRTQILLKGSNAAVMRKRLSLALEKFNAQLSKPAQKSIGVTIDVDPYFMF